MLKVNLGSDSSLHAKQLQMSLDDIHHIKCSAIKIIKCSSLCNYTCTVQAVSFCFIKELLMKQN